MGVPVSTLELEPGYEIVARVGYVSTRRMLNPNVVSDWFSGWGDFFGARRNTVWTRSEEAAEAEILDELGERAAEMGADMVLGVRFVAVAAKGDSMAVLKGCGTAVRVAKRA